MRFFRYLAVLVLAGGLAAGCAGPFAPPSADGALNLIVNGLSGQDGAARTIGFPDVAAVEIRLTYLDNPALTVVRRSGETVTLIAGLKTGVWRAAVFGLGGDGSEVATAASDVLIAAGKTARVNLTLRADPSLGGGTGGYAVSFTFPNDVAGLDVARVDYALVSVLPAGALSSADITREIAPGLDQAILAGAGIAAGSYILVADFINAQDEVVYPFRESLLVFSGQATEKAIDLAGGEFGKTPPPPAVLACWRSGAAVVLGWSRPVSYIIEGYRVYVNGVLAATLSSAASGWTDNAFSGTGVSGYRVAAYNHYGESVGSPEIDSDTDTVGIDAPWLAVSLAVPELVAAGADFTARATADGPVAAWRWYLDGVEQAGAVGASLTLTAPAGLAGIGRHRLTAVATKTAGAASVDFSASATYEVRADIAVYDFESNVLPVEFLQTGPAAWAPVAAANASAYSLSLDGVAMRDGDTASLSLAGLVPSGRILRGIGFALKVSSQNGADFLRFYDGPLDVSPPGDPDSGWSGEVAWTTFRYNLAAPIPAGDAFGFRWEYVKDLSLTSGADTVWLDDIVLYY